MIEPIVSRVRRNAPVETSRNQIEPAMTKGKMPNVISASVGSRRIRITIVPMSVRPDWNNVTTESVTRLSSASMSLVIREIRTPAGRLS